MARIVFMNHDYPLSALDQRIGGAEGVVLHLSQLLAEKGHVVSILAPSTSNASLSENLSLYSLGDEYDLNRASQLIADLKADFLVMITRGDLLSQGQIDRNCRKIIWFHETNIERTFRSAGELNESIDSYIYISEFQRKYYEGIGLATDKGSVIFNPYDSRIFYPRHVNRQHGKILYAGALVPEKGIDILIEAYLKIKNTYPQASLHLCGSEEMWARPVSYSLRRVALEKDNIFLRGQLVQSDLAKEYATASVTVLPTLKSRIIEGLGMASIEAQACGCPVIVSDSGGLPETVVEGVTGLILKEESVDILAEYLQRFLDSEEMVNSFGRQGILFVKQKFDVEQKYPQYLKQLGL